MSYERLVELQRWPGIGFGFSVIGGSDTHIPPMICALVRDSPALLSKRVFVGDVLYKVNGAVVSNLETKQVVDLIRNCKDKIILSLREDRLAKLKARPFLAEDSLIEPPRASKSPLANSVRADHCESKSLPSTPREQHKSPGVFHKQQPKSPGVGRSEHEKSISYRPKYKSPGAQRHHRHSTDTGIEADTYRASTNNVLKSHSYSELKLITNTSKTAYTRTLDDSRISFGYGSNGMFMQKDSDCDTEALKLSKMSIDSENRNANGPVSRTAHIYDLDNLPPSPRSFESDQSCNTGEKSYKSLANSQKYESDSYSRISFAKRKEDGRTNDKLHKKYSHGAVNKCHKNTTLGTPKNEFEPASAPPYKQNDRGYFDFEDGACASFIKQHSIELSEKSRPHSNPEIENALTEPGYYVPESTFIPLHNESHAGKGYRRENSNYSSPNVFQESERMYSEHKGLTLTPHTTYSVHSLNSRNYFEDKDMLFNENHSSKHLSPISINTPNSSYTTSLSSPTSMSSASSPCDNVGPADIASRLFTLNGYKDTDVAPLLGKNSETSKQTCREYLRFFSFEGLSLDEALRVFLDKFPLTGETQERERILIQFSKRHHECNQNVNMSEDSVHTLVCAIMLLNTDLHNQSISNRMSLNDFIVNLSGLNDGADFSKEYLKTLYHAIKNKEIIFARAKESINHSSPKPKRKNSAPGNPFIELKTDSNDAVLCEGLIYRKSVMDTGGRRTPALRRNWRPCYCVLKGLVLLSYKPDSTNSQDPQIIGVHHALAGYAKDYKKRAYVFKIISADWSVYYIQAKNQDEVRVWMDSINVSAAMLSSPPLPPPVGSSIRFQRPVMPVSRTRLSLEDQISHHKEKVRVTDSDLNSHVEYTPDPQNKHYQDWENKLDYLEFELKRFKAYVSVLTASRLEPIRSKISSSLTSSNSSKLPETVNGTSRSVSMHSLATPQPVASPRTKRMMEEENRSSYFLGPSSP